MATIIKISNTQVAQAKQGDSRQWEILFSNLEPLVDMKIAGARQVYGTLRYDEAELESRLLDGIMHAVSQFDTAQGASFNTYLNHVLNGRVLDYLKGVIAHNNVVSYPLNDKYGDGDRNSDEMMSHCSDEQAPSALDILLDKEKSALLNRLFKQHLTPTQYDIMKHLHGLAGVKPVNAKTLAKRMGITEANISYHKKNAEKALKKLENEYRSICC